MSEPIHLVIHTDGAARGNPGPAGIGVHVADGQGRTVAMLSRYLGHSTNNQAEYAALILALECAAARNVHRLEILMDSELVVRQLQGSYRVRSAELRPLYERCKALLQALPSATVRYVPRAANRQADGLANKAIDEAISKQVDKH